MNDNHYPAGSGKGGQFAPKNVVQNQSDSIDDGNAKVLKKMGLDDNFIRKERLKEKYHLTDQDLIEQESIDKKNSRVQKPSLNSYSPEIQERIKLRYREIVKNEPQITNDIKEINKISGGELVMLEHRIKAPDSTAEKINVNITQWGNDIDEAFDRADDLIRYTVVNDSKQLTNTISEFINGVLEKGYKVKDLKNRFVSNPDSAYKDVCIKLISPSGEKLEVQFNTPEGLEIKTGLAKNKKTGGYDKKHFGSHFYYDEKKKLPRKPEDRTPAQQKRYDYIGYKTELLFTNLPIPEGIEKIK